MLGEEFGHMNFFVHDYVILMMKKSLLDQRGVMCEPGLHNHCDWLNKCNFWKEDPCDLFCYGF